MQKEVLNDGLRNLGRANSRKIDRKDHIKNFVREFETSNSLKPKENNPDKSESSGDDSTEEAIKRNKKNKGAPL